MEGKKEVFGKSVESSLKLTWEPGYEDRGQDCSSPVLRGCKDSLQKYKMLHDSLKHRLLEEASRADNEELFFLMVLAQIEGYDASTVELLVPALEWSALAWAAQKRVKQWA